jgi:3-oxoacyl-[acyl-carrier protein] reductase
VWADVAINYATDEGAAEETARAARGAGVRAMTYAADARRVEDAARLAEAVLSEFGRIDILVCNAGIWEGAPVEEIDEELWDRVIDINLKGNLDDVPRGCALHEEEEFRTHNNRQFDRRAARRSICFQLCGVERRADIFR